MSYIEQLEGFKSTVTLRKLRGTTFVSDCCDELLVYLGCSRVGHGNRNVFGPDGQTMGKIEHFSPCVWECRIGNRGASHYGQSAEQAAMYAVLLELNK